MFSFTAHLAKPGEFLPKTPRNDERMMEPSGTSLAAPGSLELCYRCPYSTTPARSIPKIRCLEDKPSRSHSTHAASKTLFYPPTSLRQNVPAVISLCEPGDALRAAEQRWGMRPERSGHRSGCGAAGQQRPSAASISLCRASLPAPRSPGIAAAELGPSRPFSPHFRDRRGDHSISIILPPPALLRTALLPGELEPFH